MARAQGFACDNPTCNTFVTTTDSSIPDGWYQIILPRIGDDSHSSESERKRDLCSARCIVGFGRERREFEGDVPTRRGNGQTVAPASASPRPAARPASTTRRTPNPDLVAFFEMHGVPPAQRGAIAGGHVRGNHDREPKESCLVCQFIMMEADG